MQVRLSSESSGALGCRGGCGRRGVEVDEHRSFERAFGGFRLVFRSSLEVLQ
jgi:hypothetical protein